MKTPFSTITCLLWVTGVTCQYDNDSKCKDAQGVCGETRSCNGQIWPNMCPFDKPHCCIVNSAAEDVYCIKIGGYCLPGNETECSGHTMDSLCSGPGSRLCCYKVNTYTYDDSKCITAKGQCSGSSICDNGRVLPNMCPRVARNCCIKNADVTDASCTLMGGYCATKTETPCDGIYWPSLCGRSTTRECCVKEGFPPSDDLKCKAANGVCGETRSCDGRVWPNMCPLDKPYCCIVNSTAEDVYCIKIGGFCYESGKETCHGFNKRYLCARPNSRRCCVKEFSERLDESKCIAAKGKCSRSSMCDNGRVWPDLCPNDSQFCCISDADITDVDCTLTGGYCVKKTKAQCDGTYWPSLCGRSTTRECCIKKGSPPRNDRICTNSNGTCVATTKCEEGFLWPRMCPVEKPHCCVESSRRQDIHCIENGGYCVRSNGTCDGELWPSLCDDEARKCCIKGSISTDVHCVENGGYCVRSNGTCDGEHWHFLCDDEARGCCIKGSISTDIHCIENGGYCVGSNGTCDGELWPSLCNGKNRECCIEGSISTDIDCFERGGYCLPELSSNISNEKVIGLCGADRICRIAESAGKGDEPCRNISGACRDVSVKCRDGKYVDRMCADEPERKCCVLDKNGTAKKTDLNSTDSQLKVWTEWKVHEREDQRNILFRVQGIVTKNCTTSLGDLCFTPMGFEARLEECDLSVNKSLCGEWGEWSECSSSCGKGSKIRKRGCNKACCKPATKMYERSQKESCSSVSRNRKMAPDSETFKNSDRRPSAIAIGVVGIICMIVPAVFIILMDVMNFLANRRIEKEKKRLREEKRQTVKSSKLNTV